MSENRLSFEGANGCFPNIKPLDSMDCFVWPMVGYNCELSQHSSRWLNSALRDDEAVYLVSNQCKTAMAGTLCCWVSIRSNHLVIIGIWGIADLHFHMMSLMSFVKAILRLKVKKTQNDEFPVHCSPTTALQYGNKDPSAFLQWWRWFFLPNNQPAPKTLCIVGHCVGASPPHPWFTEAPSTSLSTQILMRTTRLSRRSWRSRPSQLWSTGETRAVALCCTRLAGTTFLRRLQSSLGRELRWRGK